MSEIARSKPMEKSKPCLIIADVAQGHDGSLGLAHAFIDAAANAGVNAIKFQTHIAHAESTPEEPWRVHFSPQDATRYEYWKRMEFREDQWYGLKKHADSLNLKFLSSPFSIEAVELLTRIGVAAWKVASGEINNAPMIECMGRTDIPFILSTGMSSINEIDGAVSLIKSLHRDITVLQCTSEYPCPPEKIGLNMIQFYRERYMCDVGLSDHSGVIFPGLAAVEIGIDVLEVHITLSREMFGPDVPASLVPSELKQLVDGVRYIEKMDASPINKDLLAEQKSEIRNIFGKSIVAQIDLSAGTVLENKHLALKKPGGGLGPGYWNELLGKTIKKEIKADQKITEDDLI
jgi:N,N'-diacetyllegionaminate synthase